MKAIYSGPIFFCVRNLSPLLKLQGTGAAGDGNDPDDGDPGNSGSQSFNFDFNSPSCTQNTLLDAYEFQADQAGQTVQVTVTPASNLLISVIVWDTSQDPDCVLFIVTGGQAGNDVSTPELNLSGTNFAVSIYNEFVTPTGDYTVAIQSSGGFQFVETTADDNCFNLSGPIDEFTTCS